MFHYFYPLLYILMVMIRIPFTNCIFHQITHSSAFHLIHIILIQHFADFYQTQKMDLANSDEMNPYEPETVGCVISLGTGKFPVESSEGIDVSIHPIKNPMKAAKSLFKSLANAKNLFVLLLKEVISAIYFNGTNSNNSINAENSTDEVHDFFF